MAPLRCPDPFLERTTRDGSSRVEHRLFDLNHFCDQYAWQQVGKSAKHSASSTLLGPEGTGQNPPQLAYWAGADHHYRMNRLDDVEIGAGSDGTARTLRTAQWTRASL